MLSDSKLTIQKKKIILIGNYLADNQESMIRFAKLLEGEYSKQGYNVCVIYPSAVLGRAGIADSGVEKWLRYIDKYILFLPRLLTLRASIIHICDHGNSLYIPFLQNKCHLITCHDLFAIFLARKFISQNDTSLTGKIYQNLILIGLNQAKYVACVSRTTQNDLLSVSSLKPEQTSVIYNGLNYQFRKVSSSDLSRLFHPRPELLEISFILHVGDEKWYKNRPGLLRIYSIYLKNNPDSDIYLLLAGKPISNSLKNYIIELGLQERVIEWIKPSNEELEGLYSSAKVFLFPSLSEGFGWPIIEAQACGCPVVCSNNGSLAEVAARGALTAPAENEEELAQLLGQAIHNPKTREKMIVEGYENTKQFTTEKMVKGYLDLYQKIINDQT